MLGLVDFVLLGVFLSFYVGLFYNLPVLAAGVRDLRRKRILPKKTSSFEVELPSFSVILPVKNESKVVGRILEAVSGLNYPVDRFELVIVDDGSVDGTVEICREFAASHNNVKLLQRDVSRGKANALNHGLANSCGELVAIFDADNVPANDVLVRAAEHFRDPKVAAVQGRIHSINARENMLTQFIAYEDAVWCEAFLRGKEALGLFVHLRGCCEFIRRGVLESLGGFDETTLAEDIEISTRFIEQGHRIKYAADLRAWQESPDNLRGFLKQRTRWYRGHMEVALKYGRLMKHLNRRTVDAELTLSLPFIAIASFFLFTFASWGVFAALPLNNVLMICMVFSASATYILALLAGLALIYYSKPKQPKNLLWLPFVFGYWLLQSFLALYAGLLILLRRPRRWVKTEKSGMMACPEFAYEIAAPITPTCAVNEFTPIIVDPNSQHDSHVYVVLPCYNEEKNLPRLIEDIASEISDKFPFEIVAVDDGSVDKSGSMLKQLAKKYPLRVLCHERNMGLSAALRDGLSYVATSTRPNDFIITMDADNTHKACYIRNMLEVARQGADIVVASRYVSGGVQIGVSNNRILLSRYLNSLVYFLSGLRIKDSTSGYRCYRGAVLRKGQEKYNANFLSAKGFEVQVELIIKLGFLPSKIMEIPFELRYDRKNGKSKMPLLKTIQNYIILTPKIIIWRAQRALNN